MAVVRRILAAVAALAACGTLTTTAPAEAAGPGSAPGAHSGRAARAEITDIREIINQRTSEVGVYNGENRNTFAIAANNRWTGSLWIPWVGNQEEMTKSVALAWDGAVFRYWIFQDYWNTANQVRYSTTNSYAQSSPVPGSSTGAGRKRLIVRGDGTLFLENAS
ncbi:hypothetical protein [Sinosporangium siamense]|uniref:Uncharacterized protein n=1 Tax=Sinosporangium siamense TaxID=1367973 RepID=A0A919V8I3_9ACTN|nr:hypothetical protein [Sinosporangium siamense]GII96165.1 hypothetical protein Ssi02_63960 [Sinosporangium siamense]